jgi:osmoprotectant transport system permease protein
MKRTDTPADRADLARQLAAFLRQRSGITVVAPLGFENSYAFAMRRARAEQLGVRNVSDLARVAGALSIGGDYEFFARPEWKRISEVYSLQFKTQTAMDSSLMYQAVEQGAVDVLSAFSTDGRIAALDLVVLDDDRHVIPPYDAVILVSQRLARRHPHAVDALRGLSGRIDAKRMRIMNRQVDVAARSPRSGAAGFLDGLAPGRRRSESRP